MSRLLTITATNQAKVGVRKRTVTGALRFGPVSAQLLLIIAGTVTGFFYLVQSNHVSTQNLQLQALQDKKDQITQENERLSIEAARLQSVQQIKKAADDEKLQQSGKPTAYVPG